MHGFPMTAPAWAIDTTGTGSSSKLGAPAQNKEATDLPSSFFKTGVPDRCTTVKAALALSSHESSLSSGPGL